MAVKNLQTLVRCNAVVTGTREDSMRANGCFQASFLSLSRLALAEPFPQGMNPDNGFVLRAGRSASSLGVVPGAGLSAAYHRQTAAMWPMMTLVLG